MPPPRKRAAAGSRIVNVQAASNVLGMKVNQVAEVEETDIVRAHIKSGYLIRLSKGKAADEQAEQERLAELAKQPKPPDPETAGQNAQT